MNTEEKLEIAQKLQSHHYFFRSFWDIGAPVVGKFDNLPTAAISFDEKGEAVSFLINEDFWNSLNEESKLFLVCHEMCHIILEHGRRFSEYIGTNDIERMNRAADVVINEMLCESFGFFRNNLDTRIKDEGCWLNTVFKKVKVDSHESTEYYFNKLKEEDPDSKNSFFSIDSHIVLTEEQQEQLQDFLQKNGVSDSIDSDFIDKLPQKEKENLSRSASGTGSWFTVDVKKKKKKKWESVIKKWENSMKKDTVEETERWERVNSRYSQIISDKIHLPTNCKVLDEYKEKNKIDVFFFLDTSGSCINLKDRFFSAANSLDPKKFNIRLFCFDTRVVETSLSSGRVYGGGGTSFSIIERHIQSVIKTEKKKYPKAVFLITDGLGDIVHPEKPDRWYWFLSYNYRSCIPSKSKIFMLSEYE
jgi:predicted metal-dependent peptidase